MKHEVLKVFFTCELRVSENQVVKFSISVSSHLSWQIACFRQVHTSANTGLGEPTAWMEWAGSSALAECTPLAVLFSHWCNPKSRGHVRLNV